MIDATISLGNILTIVTMGGTAIGFVMSTRYEARITRAVVNEQVTGVKDDIQSVKGDVSNLEDEMKKLVEVLIQQGRHEERMNAIDNRMSAQGQRVDDLTRKIDRVLGTAS